jgi:hypothetical protein
MQAPTNWTVHQCTFRKSTAQRIAIADPLESEKPSTVTYISFEPERYPPRTR